MKRPGTHTQSECDRHLHERIGLLMVRGQFRSALELLDRVIEDPLPLFQGEAWVNQERRLAWLYRINLLRERDRVVGATNLLERIDPAVLRPGRLDKKFFVGPPDYEARMDLVKLCMANRPQEDVDWETCASELEGYTCAEIEFVVNEAARNALSEHRAIITGDIRHAAGNNPPAHADALP